MSSGHWYKTSLNGLPASMKLGIRSHPRMILRCRVLRQAEKATAVRQTRVNYILRKRLLDLVASAQLVVNSIGSYRSRNLSGGWDPKDPRRRSVAPAVVRTVRPSSFKNWPLAGNLKP